MPTNRKCPDCDRRMTRIRLIDKAHSNLHKPLSFALGDAKPGMWFGTYPIEGRLEGMMCDKCGRVLLYAEPEKK
jgi:hypothetical protein